MGSTINTDKIGKLGFGYMRLPRNGEKIDYEHSNGMADIFLESGGTYFDVAYVYDGAEVALRETVIKRHPRESFQVASKLPCGMIGPNNPDLKLEDLFNTSIERLGTDYIDFYLLHGINSSSNKHVEEIGAWDYVAKLKKEGKIRHLGFSFHGYEEDLDEILTAHPETEFVQLQINFFDWDNPKVNGRRLHEIAVKHNKPIIIMEPLLGGKLASTESPIAKIFKDFAPNAPLASWSLRFVDELEGVFTTLSGMSNYEQIAENIKIYSDIKPLSKEEHSVIEKAVEALKQIPNIACTECNYCKDCPSKIRIPQLIGLYNSYLMHKTDENLGGSYGWMTNGHGKAKDCTACGICETACPQDLEIIDTIAKLSTMFDK